MRVTVANLYEEALQLSEDSRIELAERLIASTETPQQLFEEQLAEVRQRMANLDSGRSCEIPGAEAHRLARQAIAQRA